MKKSLLFMFISFMLLLLCCTQRQTSEDLSRNDSIEKYLKWAGNYSLTNAERNKWNEKAFGLIDLSKNDTVERWYLCQTAYNYSIIKNAKRYFSTSKIHFKKTVEANDTLNLGRFYKSRAAYYKDNTSRSDSAFYFYVKAEKFYKKTNKKNGLARIYFEEGLIKHHFDDYLGANFSANQAYTIIKNDRYGNLSYDVLNLLGNTSHNLKEYKKAIIYHQKALVIAKQLKLKSKYFKLNFISTSLNNIGNSYKELKNYKKAISFFEEGLKQKNLLIDDPEIYAFLISNLAYCRMVLHQNKNLPQLFIQSARIFDSLAIKNECAISNVYLSDFYFRLKDTSKAIAYSQIALQLAKEAKAPYYYLTALSQAGSVNKDKAPQYIKEYHKLNDSLQFEQRKARSQFYKIQLETDEIAQEKDKAIKQKWLMASVISGVLLIVILLFVIYRQRSRQKELHLRQSQQQTNEEIYQLMLEQQSKVEEARQLEKKRIALELHDGVMNRLVSTRMNLFVLSRKNDPETIANCLGYIADIREIENEIRDLSHNLNRENFNEKGSFKTLLEQFVALQNNYGKTQYHLDMDSSINWDAITNEAKMHLYRIVQEATNNINKHAGAKKAVFDLTPLQNYLHLAITDDGIGFDSQKTKEGIGLKNILQRVSFLNGSFEIQSDIHKGTTLMIAIPLTAIQ